MYDFKSLAFALTGDSPVFKESFALATAASDTSPVGSSDRGGGFGAGRRSGRDGGDGSGDGGVIGEVWRTMPSRVSTSFSEDELCFAGSIGGAWLLFCLGGCGGGLPYDGEICLPASLFSVMMFA